MSANSLSPGPNVLVMMEKLVRETRDHNVLLLLMGTKTATIVVPLFPQIVSLGILKIMTSMKNVGKR
jgi:hypothetical protein